MFWPFQYISPVVGIKIFESIFINVVLPMPFRPLIWIMLFGASEISTLLNIVLENLLKDKLLASYIYC